MTEEKERILPANVKVYATGDGTRTAQIELPFHLKQSPAYGHLSEGWEADPVKLEQVEAQAFIVAMEDLHSDICARGLSQTLDRLIKALQEKGGVEA